MEDPDFNKQNDRDAAAGPFAYLPTKLLLLIGLPVGGNLGATAAVSVFAVLGLQTVIRSP